MGYALVKVSKHGTITLPKEFRKKYGIKEDDYVKVEETKNGVRIVGAEVIELNPVIREAQEIAEKKNITVGEVVKSVRKERPKVYREVYGED
ncbi:MAG: AbrB/MazE/SpoVT family DNA-binding domain-containing protein [Candidatus Hydrothermarchaeota archaeon]|nr:AbrB/MazE/SpoVT family DNA-binding domain-containing protein [Candidatus Hydrothermarchaeota archaeon]